MASHCREHSVKRDILVEQGDVRRAFRVVDVVYREVMKDGRVQNGVVLMTAVLLVECLAITLNREAKRSSRLGCIF